MRYFKTMIALWFAVTVMVICPLRVKAETAPNGLDYNIKYHYRQNYQFQQFVFEVDYYFQKPVAVYDGKWWIWDDAINSRHQLQFHTAPSGVYTNITTYIRYINPSTDPNTCPDYCMSVSSGGSGSTVNPYPSYPESTGDFPVFTTVSELDEYLQQSFVDFDNPYYDPLIPVPDVEITYRDDYSNGNPYMPLNIALKNADDDLYLEVVMVNYMPSSVKVEWQNYSANYSHRFAQRDLIPHAEYKISTDISSDYIGTLANTAWGLDVASYPVTDVYFVNAIGTDTNAVRAFNNMVDNYGQARKVGCFYGNNTEFYFRYFYVDGTKFVVSSWRTWSSQYSDTFGIELPSYYKTYDTASGYENTSTDTSIIISPTSNPDSTNPANQVGVKKGSNITINIGQNVPNRPDYPTIASYNLDNLLVSTIDNVKGLGNFFSGFAGFCTATFAWIPHQIWQIIAIGFALSIVVMFLKIL